MARVSFSALIESILGKLAGSVFQDSYGGFQIRTRVSPRNPQTNFQQLRRGEFGYISSLWRTLSTTDRQTFIDAAGSPSGGLNLFIESNVNLSLLDIAPISVYATSAAPPSMPIQITAYNSGALAISAASGLTTVPAGYQLVIFATYEKAPTKIFTNPSQFSPVVNFAAGTSIAAPTSIAAEWISRYGILRDNKRLCVKSALIDITNGNRTDTAFVCANSIDMLPYAFYYAQISQTGTNDPVVVEAPGNTLGPIVWTRTAAGLYVGTSSGLFTDDKTFLASVSFGRGLACDVYFYRSASVTVNLNTYFAGVATDGFLDIFCIQIIVFP